MFLFYKAVPTSFTNLQFCVFHCQNLTSVASILSNFLKVLIAEPDEEPVVELKYTSDRCINFTVKEPEHLNGAGYQFKVC